MEYAKEKQFKIHSGDVGTYAYRFEYVRTLEEHLHEQTAEIVRLKAEVDRMRDWPKANRRRGSLITKSIASTITEAEQAELDALQDYADHHIEQVAPRPESCISEAGKE
jgi:oligoribonuclease (3'-5' exoribonuclease)